MLSFDFVLIAFFIGSPDKPQKDEDFIIEALKVEPACFHICGNSQTDIDSAKQWINDLIFSELNTTVIDDNAILSFSDTDYQYIENIQKTVGVSVRVESKKGQASVTIEGLCKDVLKANNDIHDILRKAREEEVLQRKIELTGTVVEWQYQQQGFQFQSFDATTNYHLEEALVNNQQTVKVTVQGQDYTVTMPSGPATNNKGHVLQIKRIDKLKGISLKRLCCRPASEFC